MKMNAIRIKMLRQPADAVQWRNMNDKHKDYRSDPGNVRFR
jgi:hypothetical protein